MGERRVAPLARGLAQEQEREHARDPVPARAKAPASGARQLALLPEVADRTTQARNGIAAGWLTGRAGRGSDAPRGLDPLALQIGAAIAERRQRLGLSQAELADTLGCDRSAVSRWEMGLRLPSMPHLVALGRALGCGARALLPE